MNWDRVRVLTLTVDNKTTPQDFDEGMRAMFARRREIEIQVDATRCSALSFKRIMRILPVVEKHRENARRYVKHTTVTVANPWIARVVRFSIPFVRPESPVFVNTFKQDKRIDTNRAK